jgi:hypothetical protein
MALFSGFRARRAASKANEIHIRQGFAAAGAALEAHKGLGGAPWAHFAVSL